MRKTIKPRIPREVPSKTLPMVILAVLLVIVLVIASVIAIRQARAQGLNVWTITVIGQDAELGTVTLRLEDLEALVRGFNRRGDELQELNTVTGCT